MQSRNIDYKICTRCIMDTSDPDITFDDNGVCNHCHRYDTLVNDRVYTGAIAKLKLDNLVKAIKKSGNNKEYDCIIGVSGGVDSTYVAYLTKKLGLKPLAIHFDNGWNSELAVSNIEHVLNKLGIDLYTYVVDWQVFKDLQLSFLKASTPDGEIPTDHAINALLFNEASKRNIKYVISGMNFTTESVSVPSWSYGHSDWTYIKGVHKKFGNIPLKRYPHFSLKKLFYFTLIKRIKVVSILNYVNYNKEKTISLLENELEWRNYGGKHYESVYTRFFQGYILPRKFNIDKRKGHLSDLINAKQLTRNEALIKIKEPIMDESLIKTDLAYVLKKFKISSDEFNNIMEKPIKSFKDYKNQYDNVLFLKKIVNTLRKKNLYSR